MATNKTSPTNAAQVTQNADYTEAVKQFVQKGGFDYFKQLETDYDCAGLCKVPLFYMTKDAESVPKNECADQFLSKYSAKTGVGVIALVTALLLCGAGICALPLCCAARRVQDGKTSQ